MYKILELKEKVKAIYSGYSMYIDAAFKFLIALVGMLAINSSIGTMGVLQNPIIIIIVSLMCALLPQTLTVMILMVFILGHITSIAMEVGLIIVVLYILMYLLFFRFTPKESIVLVLVPLCFFLKIPYIIPIMLGLIASPVSIVSVAFGTVIHFILSFIGSNYDAVIKAANADGFKALSMIADGILLNASMYFTIAVFAVIIVMVYVIKRLSIDYSWIIAVCAGGIMQIVLFLVGNIVIDMSLVCSIVSALIGGVICTGLAWFLQFFIHSVDYTRTEHVQFEDDEYYYYVKAVPKVSVAAPEVKVQRVRPKFTK